MRAGVALVLRTRRSQLQIVTISARNFLPMARTLARSVAKHSPEHKMHVLVVDALPDEPLTADDADFNVIRPSDLPLAPDEFARMALIYDVTELSTALKPWALEYLLSRGAEVAVYLDPDIEVFGDLSEIHTLATDEGVVLTPHTLAPMPRDELRPTEADIMGSGIFNLGFIAVGAEHKDFLGWWQERLRRDAISAPERMMFTDQRWIDWVPALFPHHIVQDPGYNVAYWNIHERPLERDGERLTAGGSPVKFVHFSGYRPDDPAILSKHVADRARVLLSEQPVLREICDKYRDALFDAGWGEDTSMSYRFNTMESGAEITVPVRRSFRDAVLKADRGEQDYPPDMFSSDSHQEALSWLRQPAQPGSRINRALHFVWSRRGDLRTTFPNAHTGDAARFLAWASRHGVEEGEIDEALLPHATADDSIQWKDSDEAGVNLFGYFGAELGMGQLGRLVVDAVRLAGLGYSTHRYLRTPSRQRAEFGDAESDTLYPINIAIINADQIPLWAADVGRRVTDGRYTVGVWAWESEDFPKKYSRAFRKVDEVWAISNFVRDAIAQQTSKPVHVIPIPALETTMPPRVDRERLGIPAGDYFLFCFDFLSIAERKNPLGLIEAFGRAFADGAGPTLVIKTINGERRLAERERLRYAAATHSNVLVIDDYLDSEDLRSLIGGCLAYVSLHRSEGTGLTLLEAMSFGRPVIATAYSGNMDFMDEHNSLLVPYAMIEIPSNLPPYGGTGASWADPDLDTAAKFMRMCVEDPSWADEIGRRGRETAFANTGLDKTAEFIQERIGAIMAERNSGRPDPQEASAEKALVVTRKQIARPLKPAGGSRLGPIGSILRRALFRVLRPYDRVVARRLDAKLKPQSRKLKALANRLAALEPRVEASATQIADLAGHVNAVRRQVNVHDTELAATPYKSDPDAFLISGADGRQQLGYSERDSSDYAAFEDAFRGTEEFISARLSPYVSMVRGAGRVVDLGCGRGEFLELLRTAGIDGLGVELDSSMLERCRARGLEVVEADAIAYLEDCEAGSIGAITSIQFIEHIPAEALRPLFEATFRALRPGGLMIAETVNPHSPMALKTFWLDLTHVRPLFPESLLQLAMECGFSSARIEFPVTRGNSLKDDLRYCGEYAIVATKPER